MVIYKVTNKLNGKIYIGQTKRAIKTRWKEHSNINQKRCRHLRDAIAKYGIEQFTIEIVCKYSDQDTLNDAEEYFVMYYNSLAPEGYNLVGGGRVTKEFSAETLKRMSDSHLGQIPSEYNIQQSKKANIGKPTWNAGLKGYTNSGSFKKGGPASNGSFKPGHIAPNKGRTRIINETGQVKYIYV